MDSLGPPAATVPRNPPGIVSGEKAKACDILAAIRTLRDIEREGRGVTAEQGAVLARFRGFGGVALCLFPDPITGEYKEGFRGLAEELRALLRQEEYDGARRATFSQFFTSQEVMSAMHGALTRLGIREGALVLEPGCGAGHFMAAGPAGRRYIGVELDSVSGRIARALHPDHDIRIENFRDTRLPPLDAVIGNVPFADIKLDFRGRRLSLHDFFIAKSAEALKPGGVLAVVTSHFTLDKQNAGARELLAGQADFLGAVRLPSDAFQREGTSVVADILFLRKRGPGQEPAHAGDWIGTGSLALDGLAVPVNSYFLAHPEMVLGRWSRKDTLYGGEGFSVKGEGDLSARLEEAIGRLPRASLGVPERAHLQPGVPGAPPRSLPPDRPFVAPPPLLHVTEGSFFVGDDRVIRQLEDGNARQVVYCGTTLRTDGTPQARKVGSLIRLRDLARRVLQSQNEGWPEEHRHAARRDLNTAYDRFVAGHGPINKTSFTTTKAGGTVRRMPNLVKFREDPDAMLVMALEEYDESTGEARKAPILLRDVVGPRPPITRVRTAEEGLLASLDRTGGIDLRYISGLYGKPEGRIAAELEDLIYLDPKTKVWQTADAYLSGDVREKLRIAEAAGPNYARNAEALKSVQPEDVLPGDIDANLGAPWVPEADIQAFAAELFNVPAEAVRISHLAKDAVWSVEPDYRAVGSVAATSDYGTGRINGTSLLDLALNAKTPAIYDTVRGPDGDERVLNPDETQAAREKQRLIKQRFKSWIFSDHGRTERLVRAYNDTYNNLRPRIFDGSHLAFPGMSRAIALKAHQVDAVWRCMTGGNTLLAHAVGAGKTYEMAAAGMKMKQAGLVQKPLYAVPNHMLEQFSREFMQLYPDAKLLLASKDDFTRGRRKALTAKIAANDWDGIVTTHGGFERIAMSREYQERFLRDQIREYERLLIDKSSAGRNIIKAIEKQKAARQERLKELQAAHKKDDGLVFDELGVDQLFIDEAHYFKNLETPTKMDRVAGIQTGGSERAFDLYMKARYLGERHRGRGVTFATGTPMSNTMVELYTLQRFLDPEGLTSRGIEHFDAWAATFGEVIDTMEISPDGATLKPRSRFASFVNLPELIQMFRAFADVQTADKLDLPRPKLEGGKPLTIACAMSPEQAELQAGLVRRYERIRNAKVDPREDNALAITTDGRKLALDSRMLAGTDDFPGSKINALAANAFKVWRRTEAIRGTQLVFCDLGVNPSPFSAYDALAEKLMALGIPRHQIAAIGDADTDAKKAALFEKVRAGAVRILIGSTQKMGTGTNVQKRLVALHHLDAPWKPAEVEQREGRILRQGNQNEEVAIYRYVTEGSFDAFMWQALETKARFIAQVMSGESAVRKAADVCDQELSYAEVKAIASGNPAVLTLAEADAQLMRLAILAKNHRDEQYLARKNLRELPDAIRRYQQRIEALVADMAALDDGPLPSEEVLGRRLGLLPEGVLGIRRNPLGKYRGLDFGIVTHPTGVPEAYLEGATTRQIAMAKGHPGPRAVLNTLERLARGYESEAKDVRRDLVVAEGQLKDYEERLGRPFAHEPFLRELGGLRDQLKAALSEHPPEDGAPAAELAAKIRSLREANKVEGMPGRAVDRETIMATKPVTARVRERLVRQRLNRLEGEQVSAGAEQEHKTEIESATMTRTEPGVADRWRGVASDRPKGAVQRRWF
ncbi:DEAD/DEAH box helicase family protein [Singulisphaera sp. PoT]|uniref:DEAD/DEAH box helicase family protein n=1 Tax=Singulisphaera sp. PoT TaxID=3411797 RepID=UPI003BF5C667